MTRLLMFQLDDWQTLYVDEGDVIVEHFNHHRIEDGELVQIISKYHPFEYRSFFYDYDDQVISEEWGEDADGHRGMRPIWNVPDICERELFDYMWEKAYVWV